MISRKFIKDRLVKQISGKTDAGESVFASRAIPTDIHDLPVVLIYLKNEDVEIFDESPRRYKRVANFIIECLSSGNDDNDADTKVEELARQVEDSLSIDETQGIDISDSWLGNINFQSEPDGQSPVAAAVLTFNIEYFVEPNPKTDAPDFLRSGVDWQVGHDGQLDDDVVDARDEFTIPQG